MSLFIKTSREKWTMVVLLLGRMNTLATQNGLPFEDYERLLTRVS
jgi:hypothetical protein